MARSDFASSITYSQESDFSFDSNYIEYDSGIKLKLVNNPGQDFTEDFADGTGHIYDSNLLEFSGGLLQQIDQRNYFNASFEASYNLSINGTRGLGVLTGTPINGATITNSKLDLTGGKSVNYDADLNADSQQTFCVKFKATPNFTGAPPTDYPLFTICKALGDSDNIIMIRLQSSGQLQIFIQDSTGSIIINELQGVWNNVSGIEYEFGLNVDITTGATRLFVENKVSGNCEQFGPTLTGTGTRDSNISFLNIGGNFNNAQFWDGYIDDVVIFDSVQNTTDYAAGEYLVPDYIYSEAYNTLPEMEYTGAGTLISFDAFTYTITGSLLVALQIGQSGVWTYWNGLAWATGDGTSSYMCSFADFAVNVGTLDIDGEIYGQFKIFFPDSETQLNSDELTASLTAQIYPLTNPTFETAIALTADEILSIILSETITGSDNIKYAIKQDDNWLYWNGTAWSTSSSYVTASVSSDIENNIGDLDNGDENLYYLKGYLHSNDGTTTPTFTGAIIKFFTLNFVFENGTSKTNSTSYATLAQFVQYWLDKRVDYSGESIVDIKQWLNSATEYLDITYNFKGTKTSEDQALEWPRYNVEKDSKQSNYAYYNYYDSNEIPQLIINACCYLAAKVSSGELSGATSNVVYESYGPVSKTYGSASTDNAVQYRAIDKMLKSLILLGNKLVRVK